MNQEQVKEALDKAMVALDSVIHVDYQLPVDYATDTLVHMKYLLGALRNGMSSESDPMFDTPQQVIKNIKTQADFIKTYSEEIKHKGVVA